MFCVQAKGLRRRAALIVATPPSFMQRGGGGVEGLMEKLMISVEALHINCTFVFLPEADVYSSTGGGRRQFVL